MKADQYWFVHQCIDLLDISLVVHAVHDFSLDVIALFLMEPKHFNDTKVEKAARKGKQDGKRR
jgi:hypothetical protein